jgi:hypothetical protein
MWVGEDVCRTVEFLLDRGEKSGSVSMRRSNMATIPSTGESMSRGAEGGSASEAIAVPGAFRDRRVPVEPVGALPISCDYYTTLLCIRMAGMC